MTTRLRNTDVSPVSAGLRNTGVGAFGNVPWGTHFCLFCETPKDTLDTLVPFFKAGLESNELCVWVVSPPLTEQDASSALHEAIPDFDDYLARRSLEILRYDEWYLRRGVLDVPGVIKNWERKVDQAQARGYAGLRGIGNTDWLTEEYRQVFALYERELERWIDGRHMIALCTYPLAGMNALQVFDVASVHQFVHARRRGKWQVLETPELFQAKHELKALNDELEQRVAERTRELAASNRELRRETAEHRAAEEALRVSEGRLQAAVDAAGIGLWDWDLVSGRIVWLGHHEKLFGLASHEFEGVYHDFERNVHPEDLEALNEAMRRARDQRSAYAHEYRVIWPDGSLHWLSGLGRFFYNDTGAPVRMLGAVCEITERKQADEAARESQQLVRLVLATLPVGVLVTDRAGDIILANAASEQIWGGVIGPASERWVRSKGFWHELGPADRAEQLGFGTGAE